MFGDKTQQFNKSNNLVWDEFLQKYVVDYFDFTPSNRTPEEIAQEEEESDRRAENF